MVRVNPELVKGKSRKFKGHRLRRSEQEGNPHFVPVVRGATLYLCLITTLWAPMTIIGPEGVPSEPKAMRVDLRGDASRRLHSASSGCLDTGGVEARLPPRRRSRLTKSRRSENDYRRQLATRDRLSCPALSRLDEAATKTAKVVALSHHAGIPTSPYQPGPLFNVITHQFKGI
ncbi:hypothetical protein K438DRAFT_1760003 [Mycena galopus ATCC 62051]|nr:hypothetical protein K438DRAFT_1760003 [Mycena galopus ATCC 62051]